MELRESRITGWIIKNLYFGFWKKILIKIFENPNANVIDVKRAISASFWYAGVHMGDRDHLIKHQTKFMVGRLFLALGTRIRSYFGSSLRDLYATDFDFLNWFGISGYCLPIYGMDFNFRGLLIFFPSRNVPSTFFCRFHFSLFPGLRLTKCIRKISFQILYLLSFPQFFS